MSDKIYKKLPAVLQTTAVKNFFENTVEQLFSKSNVETVQGFIGSPRSNNVTTDGKYLIEPTVTRRFYGLSPAVNTINPSTGKSEDLIFYDEFVDTIKSYGVDTHNHNKLFSENYSTYVPPINVDKLVNYSEYYWSPTGPSSIEISGSAKLPIDIDKDIIGKKAFTPEGGKAFKNGMVVTFVGDYVTPQSKTGITYIVSNVGKEIVLLPKNDNYSVTWVNIGDSQWDEEASSETINKYHSSGNITGIHIENVGIGYVNPQFLIYDDAIVDSNVLVETTSPAGGDTYANVLSLSGNVVGIENIVELESVNDITSEFTYLDSLIETHRVGDLATANITLSSDGSISSATFDSGDTGSNYTGEIKIAVFDTPVVIDADTASMGTGNVYTNTIILDSDAVNVKVGQAVTGNNISGIVKKVIREDIPSSITPKVILEDYIELNLSDLTASPTLTFKGRDFHATIETDYVVKTPGAVNIKSTQAIVGVNPNDSSDYYLIGGIYGFDQDFDGDGIGDAIFGGNVASSKPDYLLQERGAKNKNVWSRVNFWHHRDNFLDAGDSLPNRSFRANRPIIEFDSNLELYNHGTSTIGAVISASTGQTFSELDSSPLGATVDGSPMENSTFIFPGEVPEIAKYVYTAVEEGGVLRIKKIGDPILNPANTKDGDILFVPLEVKINQTVQISNGLLNRGKEYYWSGSEWILAQSKFDINQAPLFNLYDVDGTYLGDNGVYPNNTFAGNRIFGYATRLPEQNQNLVLSPVKDSELDFKLVYKQFKSSSEIVFENFQNTQTYTYQPIGSNNRIDINGYLYYKLDKKEPEYHAYWRVINNPSEQRIITTYEYTQIHKDNNVKSMSIGCIPELNSFKSSGYDIDVSINGKSVDSFTYGVNKAGFIDFVDPSIFNADDFIEISALSKSGLQFLDSNSKFEMPISFGQNTKNIDISFISEPEYLNHFTSYLSRQDGFSGNVLGTNNFDNTAKDPKFATDIIQTNQDVILGAFLLDDQPHNIVDSLRFCGNEYIKYKNRVKSEIDNFYTNNFNENMSVRNIVEEVIKRVITYKVGKLVFNRTYVLPFGDTFKEEQFTVALDQTEFVLESSVELNNLENSLLIYKNDILMVVDKDYTISSFNPITINFTSNANLQTSDKIFARLYDGERDSAQCPPTPSTMGLYPLFTPEKTVDASFTDPLEVIVGHDGSITEQYGDIRDDILLEIENRIFNAAKREFRYANSLPEYNENIIRGGAFRTNTGFDHKDFGDLTHHYFTAWLLNNQLDAVNNEFYDESNEWTWNYGKGILPGNWKGVYCHYFDTLRPNTHPWEMLGFTEKPLWWDEEYYLFEIDDLGRQNPYVDYTPNNVKLWEDLEQGIIRKGPRENIKGNAYVNDNPYRRIGLHEIIPVDTQGKLISPYRLFSTETTTKSSTWENTTGTQDSAYSFRTESFLNIDGVNVSFDTSNVYVESRAIPNHPISELSENIAGHVELNGKPVEYQDISYAIPRKDLNLITVSESDMVNHGAIAVLVNGLPLYNLNYGKSYANQNVWHYNQVADEAKYNIGYIEAEEGLLHYHTISPQVVGLQSWDTANHSPIVGWAFDGLPIYGPYGYTEYHANGIVKNSEITSINSSWVVRDGNRASGPGGAHTGTFIEDYRLDAVLEGSAGYTDRWNKRYGCTPDSPNTPIQFYVSTIDENNEPSFPYHVGGGIKNADVWAGKYFSDSQNTGMLDSIMVRDSGGLYTNATVTIHGDGSGATATATYTPYDINVKGSGKILGISLTNAGKDYTYATAEITGDGVRAKLSVVLSNKDNSKNRSAVNQTATASVNSTINTTLQKSVNVSDDWQFGDLSPVEYVWRKSEGYPFAIAEALMLAKPGKFATNFAEPTKLFRPNINKAQLFNKDTKKRWQFYDPAQFHVHGDYTAEEDFISNVGYTQFIHSWLTFQGLDTKLDFADKMRTLNVKLAHRMAGFIDKDTMSLRTDRYSTSGNASSLIIPKENINVFVHSSNYKSRNFYSGIIIEKTNNGYKIRGYDKSNGYFTYYETDKNGLRENVTIGGKPADFITWEPNKSYRRATIVSHLGRFYEARLNLTEGTEFSKESWSPLPSLPQIGGARGVHYQENTGKVLRAYYDKEFYKTEELYDFLVGLGMYQKEQGFDFGEYDTEIADTRDWAYAAKQFLFWTTGKWEVGNTLELSPMATKAKFNAPRGFIAKINRIDREQFSIVNQTGAIINPEDCSISRIEDSIEIVPPKGEQIYGLLTYTKEIEHAITIDNITEFNDLIFDEVFNQKHSRLKFKGNRTKNWKGKFLTEGFIIENDELIPNLDNLAESLGRYHELGFIPVQKQIYDASRGLFGYQERKYLKELDLNDDQQYEFYTGMIQNKGTSTSLSQISRNKSVLEGNVTIYDEWALKAGEFGDLNNNKNIELKLLKTDIVADPQQVTLQLPESVTYSVSDVEIIQARYGYRVPPSIELPKPNGIGVQATAKAILTGEGFIGKVDILEPGSGYTVGINGVNEIGASVIAANVTTSAEETKLGYGIAKSNTSINNGYVDLSGTSSTLILKDHISNSGNITLNIGNGVNTLTISDFVDTVNSNATLNVNITAKSISSDAGETLFLYGKDFEVINGAGASLENGRYQPIQRYALVTTLAEESQLTTSESDIRVALDGVVVPNNVKNADGNVTATNWTFTAGHFETVKPDNTYPRPDTSVNRSSDNDKFNLVGTSANVALTTEIIPENLIVNPDNTYKFISINVDNQIVKNVRDELPDPVTGNSRTGVVYSFITNPVTGNATHIHFPDVTKLPNKSLTESYNPPVGYSSGTAQREIVKSITPDTKIEVIVKSAIQFEDSFKDDVPGKNISVKVLVKEGIAVKLAPRRTYEISKSDNATDTILIDIDDKDRFLKKPRGISNEKLWLSTDKFNHNKITDNSYPTVRHAGYVSSANVNYQAFNLASLPDLFSQDILIKPDTNDLIHVAKSENRDWNVYRLNRVPATQSFIFRNPEGEVNLYTDYSLFNYLDTNQIGEPNTGKFLDYFLTIKNSSISDNVMIWNNEDIVQATAFGIQDFKAPRMVEARIASIKPQTLASIANIEPERGSPISGLTLSPINNSNTVIVTGTNFTNIENLDYISLVDNVPTVRNYKASIFSGAASNVLTFNTAQVSNIVVSNAGQGYEDIPTASITASPEGDNATATVNLVGGIKGIDVVDNGDVSTADVTIEGGGGRGASATTFITNASIVGYNIVSAGSGYANVDTVSITGTNTTPASANINIDPNGAITLVIPDALGAGYGQDAEVTISSVTGTGAVIEPILQGNVGVTMVSEGTGYTRRPNVTVFTNSLTNPPATAVAKMNASVTSVSVTNAGSGYDFSSTPTLTLSGGNPTTPASLTLNMINGLEFVSVGSKIRLTGTANANLEFRIGNPISSAEEQTLANVKLALGTRYSVTSVNPTYGRFTIQSDVFLDDTVVDNLDIAGYSINESVSFNPNVKYQITNKTPTSFRIERPNTAEQQAVSGIHWDTSKVTTSGSHGLSVGDIVRISTNTIRGKFAVDDITSGNSFVVPAKFVAGFQSGDIIKEGLEITTTVPHEITQMYADGGKRIAVHFADPLYYNKVYPVSRVSTDKLFIDDFWPKDRRTHVYYEHKTGQLNSSVPYEQGNASADFANATNVIAVTSGQRLREYVVSYKGNAKVISQQHISFQGNNQDTLVVSPNALPGNTSISVGIDVVRQRPRLSNRYPVITTVDHGKMMINGSTMEVETWNNSKALADNINKNMSLRNAFTLPNSEKFGLQFAMLKDPNTPLVDGASANEISNYGPYVKDAELIKRLSDNQLTIKGNVTVSTGIESSIDTNFYQGSSKKGPDKGLVYIDDDNVQWVWSPAINQYRPVRLEDVYGTGETTVPEMPEEEPTTPPEFHVDATQQMFIPDWEVTEQVTIDGADNPEETFIYREGDLVLYNNAYWVAVTDINLLRNTDFIKVAQVTVGLDVVEIIQWKQVSTQDELQSLYDSFLILKFVPGTGSLDTPILPGNKLSRYNMRHKTTYTIASTDYELPTFRLKPNIKNSFEVYQAVQNDDDDIYYILLDKSSPPSITHDFYGTVASYSDFNNYPTTDYYYTNGIVPSLDSNNKITNAKDPIRLQNNGKVVEISAVEPAGYVGKQLVPEPYAVSGGNGSDAIQNILGLTDIRIYEPDGGGAIRVEALTAGDDEFLMWTPGLTPGEWSPNAQGPGPLPGRNSTTVNFGFGRGYYAENDGHLPTDYPTIESNAYNRKMPRLKYNRRFSVNNTLFNYQVTTYFLDGQEITAERYNELLNTEPTTADRVVITVVPPGGPVKAGETDNWLTRDDANISFSDETVVDMIRPEEIFVACFWTEPFLYRNQIVNWDFTNLDANGYPSPVIEDYNGTVARCKYIRLTEVPPNAITRRLIPDTGWAGRGWNNRIIDNETIDLTQDDPWAIFRPTLVSGGSTGDDDEGSTPPLGVGTPNTGTSPSGTYLVDSTGGLRPDLEPKPEVVPTTDAGPVLTGGFLNTLGGPCETPLPPESPDPQDESAPCLTAKSFRRFKVYDNTSSGYKFGIDRVDDTTQGTIGLIETMITGEHAYRVFFNLIEDNELAVDSLGIVIVQSKTEYPKVSGGDRDGLPVGLSQQRAKDWMAQVESVFIKDTQWREGLPGIDGSQVGAYGITPYEGDQVTNNVITEGLGLPGDFTNNKIPTNATLSGDGSDITENKLGGVQKLLFEGRNYNTDESGKLGLATDGLGFISSTFNCLNGEYVYVFVANDSTNSELGSNVDTKLGWRLVIDHYPPISEEEEEPNPDGCSDEELASGSRNYIQGAELKEWGSVRNLAGGLGARHTPEWNYKNAFSDNIYFPYRAPGYQRYWDSAELDGRVRGITTDRTNSDKYAGSANSKLLRTTTIREFYDIQLGTYAGTSREGRTTEIKGYFRAPLTGWYSFSGIADDTLYLWMSGKVDADKTNSDRGHSDYSSADASTYFARRNKKLVRSGRNIGHAGSGLDTGSASLPALHFTGVDDMAAEGEWFTQDGYHLDGILPSGYGEFLDPEGPYLTSKAYHWDNCLLKTGWETTNWDRDFSSSNYQTMYRSIYLEQGKYYFTRIIWGNDQGPGYAKVRWRIVEGDGLGTTGRLTFSGRSCADDDPAGNGDSGGGDSGGNDGGGGGGGCFTGHMNIAMADGSQKQIADIQIGDLVKSLNLESNKLEDVSVQGIMKPRQCIIYELELNNGTTIETTIDHPFRTAEGTWATIDPNSEQMHPGISIECGKLEIGTSLKGIDANVSITGITNTGKTETVYHLYDVGEHHNFFVEGMCVHNVHASTGHEQKK